MHRCGLLTLALAVLLTVAAACAEEPPLSLMSYNVKGLDWSNTANPTYPVASRRADLVTTIRAHAPDLLAIQEAWHRSAGGSLAEELAAACGLQHSVSVTTTRSWLPYLQQNVILSRHPLRATASLDLGPDPSSYEDRKLQLVEVQAPGGVLCLGNLHLFTSQALQRSALKKVIGFLAERCGDLPLALAGDFNFEPDQDPNSPYAVLTGGASLVLRDPVEVLGGDPAAARYNSSPAAEPRRRIDHVFVGEGATPVDYQVVDAPIPNRSYPDHLPVLMRLSLVSR